MKYSSFFIASALTLSLGACNQKSKNGTQSQSADSTFNVEAESFADLQVLRYQVPGFDKLTLQQKKLAYYLSEAALSGRDITYDQRGKYNLTIRKTLENIYATYNGDKNSKEWEQFREYCGRFWFSNGNHHHYGNEKFIPACSFEYFTNLVKNSNSSGFPYLQNETQPQFLERIKPYIFDINFQPKLVDLTEGKDNVAASSNNFYEGVTQAEVEAFYAKFDTRGNAPSWGLNSKVIKENGKIVERPWKIGGMYGAALEKVVYWLQKAVEVTETDQQRLALKKLIHYYQTGDLKDFDDYSIAWVADTASHLDVINGFIEVYNDAIGKKGTFESVVSMKDEEATKRIKLISDQAQWFEDNSPLMPSHKKKNVKGITARVITVIQESGDSSPSTPIGINLPNSDWIRRDYGSKSVSLSNIVHSYNVMSNTSGMLDEFAYGDEVKKRIREYGNLSSDLHTDMHECIGHASGQINPGVETPDKTLKTYASTLEEARADLVALYYIMDQKLVDIGVMPSLEVGKAEYDSYIMNGLISQLTRIKPGHNLEEAHMRNRQLNAMWVYEKGKKDNVIEFVKRNGKTYTKINDYQKLRVLFGELLREIQRIKSEGDYAAAKNLVETYGVKVDQNLLKEVLERFAKLNVKPYKGFIQPRLVPVFKNEEIVDVKVTYPTSFFEQMMDYAKNYSLLPAIN
ncbi:Dipeptidyl-peptidase III [Pseudopedobacter saltans DSM 12145]|uniref:Dipeptidyl-peptidase III n=1 Tax=Pseudopedobacter saltans (strain ATCC 51119 / DSM 12145 / JCM 21818 / CCUG 39354 / LMG 10337 / NBRC 100064 / NCIMB 13643) TaxID=762903 RepID=F0S4L0_PSESL|nr:dihydrofolate reductase [Pseudopedobacter saltans]ADY52001.1 Dipeptidyl-peptidase III [Pseudopedobacter saltans DSM 12145]